MKGIRERMEPHKGAWRIAAPWLLSSLRRLETKEKRVRFLLFSVFGLLLWSAMFWGLWRVLCYFKGIESVGDLLASRLLDMILVTFLGLLIFSNVITGFSTFYLSRDLELLLTLPVRTNSIYFAKWLETFVASSWMVLFFGTPVFLVYGVVYEAPWIYYLLLILTMVPFLAIPAALGIGIMMGLARLFHARMARSVLIVMAVICGVSLYVLIRFLQPERLVDPETFSGVLGYLVSLQVPHYTFLPSYWAVQVISPQLFSNSTDQLFFLGMLWSTAGAFLVLGSWWAEAMYRAGWSRAQEGRGVSRGSLGLMEKTVEGLVRIFPSSMRPMIIKDAKVFLRDPSQWSQLLLLGALIIVYLYNFAAMPLHKAPVDSWYLQNLMAFLNMGLAGFVVAAVAVRFVFPSVSMEGRAFWLIRSSPMELKDFIWGKFWASLIPLCLLSEVLVILSNALLKVSSFMMVLSSGTMFLATFSITGLGIGLGAMYPRFHVENAASISSGLGGLLYMLMAVGLVGSIVVLEGLPVYLLLHSRFVGYSLGVWGYISISVCLGLVIVLLACAFWLPMRKGIRALEHYEG